MTLVISILASAIAGALLTELVRVADRWATARGSEMTGEWFQVIPEWDGDPPRHDHLSIKQTGHRLEIEARRLRPHGERARRWKIDGYLHGNVLVAVFYTLVPKEDPSSYGVIVLHRDRINGKAVWSGTYARPDRDSLATVQEGAFEQRPIIWQRDDPAT
jgi:hypothetical protein